MRQSDADPLLSIRQAAKQVGLDKSVLARQVKAGLIRSHEGKVRVSEVLADRAANIDLTRSHRAKNQPMQGGASKRSDAPLDAPVFDAPPADAPVATDADMADGEPPEIILVDGQPLPFPVAKALKETYLARLRQLEFQVKSGELVNRAAAGRAFFECSRDLRDAWLSWPARIAVPIASELGIDARALTTVLAREVTKHLAELGEPRADL